MDARRDEPLSPALDDTEASDTLRYWLGSMRYQEALGARPKAQRPEAASGAVSDPTPNLREPTPGRKYMKLDWTGHEAFVSARRGHVELDMDVEAKGLFEDGLAVAYRRGEEDEDAQRVGHLLSFPALLLPKGELGSLLRCPIDLSWRTASGRQFTVPTAAERASSRFPDPPARLLLSHGATDTDDALPFFVDAKLLVEVLRIDSERLDDFFTLLRKKRALRARPLITRLTEMIEAQHAEDARGRSNRPGAGTAASSSAEILRGLQGAVTRRLSQLNSRTRAYPVALVVNGDQSRATAHAQRDIEAALERLDEKRLKRDTPLSRYVRGQVAEQEAPRVERCLGRFTRSGLTPHQCAALELALDRRLCAIQGPPGTGKTTLILNMVADALVRKVLPLVSGQAMSLSLVVVTSTNNAAVDNVTSALGGPAGSDRLPIALRVGSRDVTEKVTSSDLEQCLAWLERHKEPAAGEYEAALAELQRAHAAVRSALDAATAGPELERLGHELYGCAVRVREAWAAKNRSNLINVVTLALRAAKAARTLTSVLGNANKGGNWLRRLFPAFGSTLLSLGNVFPAEPDCIEQVIIDEAGQCHPGYAVSALLRARSALVIGDVHQLEPVIGLSREDERRMLRSLRLSISMQRLEPYRTHDDSSTSAQHLADRAVADRPTLTDHFRCQPAIAAVCERLCGYGLVVRTPFTSRADRAPRLESPVLWVPLAGEQRRQSGSWANDLECREVIAWVRYLLASGITTDEIGIITPFRGQLELLGQELGRAGVAIADPFRAVEPSNLELFGAPSRGLLIGTVHRFQGGERSIILLSTTVTRTSSSRFIDERENLINVAASRARDHLITVGHEATLLAGRHTRALLDGATRVEPMYLD
jgi:AAA domain-containing protein